MQPKNKPIYRWPTKANDKALMRKIGQKNHLAQRSKKIPITLVDVPAPKETGHE